MNDNQALSLALNILQSGDRDHPAWEAATAYAVLYRLREAWEARYGVD